MKKFFLIAAVVAALLALGVGAFFGTAAISSYIRDARLPSVSPEQGYEPEVRAGDGDYYYACLSAEQQVLYANIHRAASAYAAGEGTAEKTEGSGETVYILGRFRYKDYGVTDGEAAAAFSALVRDCPSFFFFVSMEALYSGRWFAPVIADEYADAAAVRAAQDAVDAGAAQAAERIAAAGTEASGLKAVHDFVLERTDYEWEAEGVPSGETHAKNIVGVLDGDPQTNSICEGYAKAVLYLSNLAGLDCLYVTSGAIAHAWNFARVGETWYIIDATNDDNLYAVDDYFLCGEDDFWSLFLSPPAYDTPSCATREEGVSWQGELPAAAEEAYGTMTEGGIGYKLWGSYEEYRVESAADAARIEIPEEAGGFPVTAVGGEAFADCASVREVVLPKTLRCIESGALGGCASLEKLTVPLCDVYIGRESRDFKLSTVFGWEGALPQVTEVRFNAGERVPQNVFGSIESVSCVVLPEGLASVEALAFSGCDALEGIVFPSTLKDVGTGAFGRCDALQAVYYAGSREEWLGGEIDLGMNLQLISARKYYYSEEEPADVGNYWHFDGEGSPVPW